MAGCHSVLLPLIVVPFSKESGKTPIQGRLSCPVLWHSFILQTGSDFLKAFLLLISYFGFSTNSDAFLNSVSGGILNVLGLKSLTSLA